MYIGSRIEEIEVTTIEEQATITLEISETLLRDMVYFAKHPSGCNPPSGDRYSETHIRTFLIDAWESYREDRY